MASAPPPPSEDALPTYEEAICSGIPLNTGARSYDSLPRSRANTGDFVSVPIKSFPVDYEEQEDAETALLKAELQRLKQENLEAKKQLLRREIENEILKGSASEAPTTSYNPQYTITPTPQPSAIIPIRPLAPHEEPTEAETVGREGCGRGLKTCATFILTALFLFFLWVFLF